MKTMQTEYGEATLLWVVQDEEGQIEVVLEIE